MICFRSRKDAIHHLLFSIYVAFLVRLQFSFTIARFFFQFCSSHADCYHTPELLRVVMKEFGCAIVSIAGICSQHVINHYIPVTALKPSSSSITASSIGEEGSNSPTAFRPSRIALSFSFCSLMSSLSTSPSSL